MLARRLVPLFALALAATLPAAAGAATGRVLGSITIPTVTTAPAIDGTLNDPAWKNAAVAHLAYSLRTHLAASEQTTVYIMTDAKFIYLGVDAKQSIPVRATQHTNGVGLDTDDEFQMDLWPNGPYGFRYKFTSTGIGTHYQYSTENNLFEPTWQTVANLVPGGYVITMKVPLDVMHGTGSGGWRIQFIRYMPVTNDPFVWSYGSSQANFNDVNYAGSAIGLPKLAALRAKPRAGVYGLGAIAAPSAGGSTSRAGVDLSVPLISGTSFVGTIHPDYSNVEVDQQTIAPTAFQRIFQEVRPFFSQGGNFYNYPNGQCVYCPGISEFYTPNIPTPHEGYALEGQQGPYSYNLLDVVGASRNDNAQAVNYVSENQQNILNMQRSSVSYPGLTDSTTGLYLAHDNTTDFLEFVRYASDAGTNVLDGAQAQRYETGFEYYTPDGSSLYGVLRKVGAYFDPVDGIVAHPDIAGYAATFFKPFKFTPNDKLTEIDFSGSIDRYHDHTGELDQTDNNLAISLTTRKLINVQLTTGSSYLLVGPDDFQPITQQGASLTYDYNLSTPTTVSFNTGRFGPGRLDSWTRSSTMRLTPRGTFSAEIDDTDQFLDSGQRYTQWLERFSVGYQPAADTSFALGVRRIIGTPPQLTAAPLFVDGWNLSAAFHRKVRNGEIYLVYGDASTFSTAPQLILKFIIYLGADKGT